jgi:hypothetical protein
MKVNSDFKDLLHALNEAGVRYLIVGGYAVMVHTEPRFTKDLDIWVEPRTENADRLLAALAHFGAPVADITAAFSPRRMCSTRSVSILSASTSRHRPRASHS